jgi:hypothetical protein
VLQELAAVVVAGLEVAQVVQVVVEPGVVPGERVQALLEQIIQVVEVEVALYPIPEGLVVTEGRGL